MNNSSSVVRLFSVSRGSGQTEPHSVSLTASIGNSASPTSPTASTGSMHFPCSLIMELWR
ncbi:hypothetical protein L195_g008263 [Trifolium pratense]|uniref:Uncharacterized protein n=1 Tax=Trifolium pratense TaxID=57577 RepID=A0A2K3P8N3_TRIPR|nr:hypothetical protein L195_g008263 [Trifolium pratense]